MLLPISNTPREYAWGSSSLLADLEGRAHSGRPEAEVWFGDHPGCPAVLRDGTPLSSWLSSHGTGYGAPLRLPYLLKLLAAESPLSIQVHPSKEQAEAGFQVEEAAKVARDAPERIYRDENHKPELIVALSDTFTAMAGLRELDTTRRLLAELGGVGAQLSGRLSGPDAVSDIRAAITWLLSEEARDFVDDLLAALAIAESPEFAAELDNARQLVEAFPGDAGVAVALLMNLVELRRGEALFVPAGVLHAYVRGLGVEIMAASDNVLRGGLTPKHIDVEQLVAILDARPGVAPLVGTELIAQGVERYATDVPDFALITASLDGNPVEVPIAGVAIVLVTEGRIMVSGTSSGEALELTPGAAALVTPDEKAVLVSGDGRIFVAVPGS